MTAGARGEAQRPRSMHLRSRLILVTLALLTGICLAIGIFSHVAMSSYLTSELDDALTTAAGRAGFPGDGPRRPVERPSEGEPEPGLDPGNELDPENAAGQRPGTFNAVLVDGTGQASALVQNDGDTEPLPEEDLAVLAGLNVDDGPQEVVLSTGTYRADGVDLPAGVASPGAVLVTGLSTAERDSTLASLDATIVSLSAAGILLTGLIGSLIIRRSLRPLEQLSDVARSVSQLPLATGEVEVPMRVPPASSQPGTEVGTVGLALNEMIDHVTAALSARQASETKVRQFVADASHELRTPLTSIRGYTELILLGEEVSPAGRAALERVDSESKRMSALVEDLLLLARLDEGQREAPADVDLTELVIETLSDAQVAAPSHRWELDLPDEPVEVFAVDAELRQVLINLLSNAHKHTPPGTVVRTAVVSSGGMAEISVTDNGQGIDPQFVDTVFTRFSRADSARTGSSGSTGLGLAIVQALVTANGGEISMQSQPGRTQFRFTVPLKSAPAQDRVTDGG